MVAYFLFQWTTIFTIGRLLQSGFSVVLSGTASSLGASFLHCLSFDVPALGLSRPFRFQDVPLIIAKASGCSML